MGKCVFCDMLDEQLEKKDNKTFFCPKCNRELKKSTIDGYEWSCDYCDEDFYDFEVKKHNKEE